MDEIRPLYAIGFFVAGTALMMFLFRNELLLFLLMGISAIGCLAIDDWKNTKKFLLAMIIGGICENMAVMLGAWSYSNAGFLSAPVWLPVGWGMCVVLLEEAFTKDAHNPRFSKRALAMAFGGTLLTGFAFQSEFLVLFSFLAVTAILIATGFYHRSEVKAGIAAAILGTVMETACIISGNWHYSTALLSAFGVAVTVWLPLCWFNAFLIMRRIIN